MSRIVGGQGWLGTGSRDGEGQLGTGWIGPACRAGAVGVDAVGQVGAGRVEVGDDRAVGDGMGRRGPGGPGKSGGSGQVQAG